MLAVQNEPYGQTTAGEPVTQYILTNTAGTRVTLIDYGAIVTGVFTPDRDGKVDNITLSQPDLAAYETNAPYFGGIVGRYANRIANAKFNLDGQEYTLFANNGVNSLHGGKSSFIKKVWASEVVQGQDGVGVKLTYVSPDQDEGYPGTLTTVVTYTLTNANELVIDYAATSDKKTVLNLTNHCYWNLGGAGSDTVLHNVLTLNCDQYLPVDEGGIPTGELADVAGTPMDFRTPHPIGDRIAETVNGSGGYDHCYIVNGTPGQLRPVATVNDPKSGRLLQISTTEPGIQFYTGNFLDGTPAVGGNEKQTAFCLEAQHFPDSPNRPEFPTTVLNPGETYSQTTIHRFLTRRQ